MPDLETALREAAAGIPADVLFLLDAAHPEPSWECVAAGEGQRCCVDVLLEDWRAARGNPPAS